MLNCFPLSQLSNLSIEDQEETQFPYAMRDLPPVSQPGEQNQTEDHHEADGSGTAPNGRLPSLPGTPSLPRPIPVFASGSPTVPQRPIRVRTDTEFQPLQLRRQFASYSSMERPLSPASRPQSPWGRFDPYESAEVCFGKALVIYGLSFISNVFT